MAKPQAHRYLQVVRGVLTVLTLAWIVRHLLRAEGDLRPPAILNGWGLAEALALVPAALLLRAWKWRCAVAPLEPKATLRESLVSYLGAIPLSLFTPARLGEFSRGWYFPHRSLHGLSALGAAAMDKYTDLLAVVAWSIPGLAALFGVRGWSGGMAAFAVLWPLPIWFGRLRPGGGPGTLRIRAVLAKIMPPPGMFTHGRSLRLVLLGMAAFGVEFLQYQGLLLACLPSAVDFLSLAGAVAVITLANALQLTVGGLGVREGLAIVLLRPMGVPPEAAVFAAFSIFLLDQLLPACLGLAMRPHGLYGETVP
jgi:glycosyltransferase 2 family protein